MILSSYENIEVHIYTEVDLHNYILLHRFMVLELIVVIYLEYFKNCLQVL